ncbi:MAG TPA: hypothetical protein VFG88_13010 [Nocardioidaceae bacterium]|jgi:hypothetical protein|nr:hypothetical protein [Nocardioidaceae bacterium]
MNPPASGRTPPVAAVDIDGVLADVRHRLHLVEQRPKDWDAFFAAAPADPLLPRGADTVRRLAEVCRVVYLSGRPERCRADTLAWLDRHELPDGELRLRRPGDFRPARVTKVEILRELARENAVSVLVDDDPEVCDAARAAGFDVLPADWMGGDERLRRAQEVDGRT